MTSRCHHVLGVVCLLVSTAQSSDWPQILGPARNGVYAGKDLADAWPKEGPPIRWQKKVGAGFSGPAVAAGKLVLFHRQNDKEIVECLESKTGKSLWSFDYPATYRDDFGFDDGPRAVPTIADGQVYTFGAGGMLHCLDFATGQKIWGADVRKEFTAPKGFFGLACSPLVGSDYVLLNIGGQEASTVILDQKSGNVRYRAPGGGASYSSPVLATFGGITNAVVLTRDMVLVLNPLTDFIQAMYPFRPPIHSSVTGATPVVVGDEIFISAAYDLGAALLRLKLEKPAEPPRGLLRVSGPPQGRLEKVWGGDGQLSAHYATPVYHQGFLYGLHGRHDFPGGTELRCVEWKTGKVRWGRAGLNGANLILADNQLLVLTERGELLRFAADPAACKETGRAQILGAGVRAYPALADGLFFARDKNRLVCLDLRP